MAHLETRGTARTLRSARPETSLCWSTTRGASCRAYEMSAPREGWFCVSTKASELISVLEGELWIEMGPLRQAYRLSTGEAGLLLRGTPHTANAAAGTSILVTDVELGVEERLGLGLLTAEMTPKTGRISARLFKEMGALAAPELLTAAESYQDSINYRRALTLETVHNTKAILSVKNIIEESFTERITLDSLSARTKLDRHYIVRGFTRNFGTSPIAYANYLRVEHFVWALLQAAPRSLTEVTLEAGITDYSTFCRKIRSLFGHSPSQLLAAS